MFTAPEIDYLAFLPLIIVFAGGLVGCLVEGFAGRGQRYAIQLPLTVGTLVLALVALVTVSRDHTGITAAGALVTDDPALVIQGLVLALALTGVMVMGERLGGATPDAFTQAGVSIPGSQEEALATKLGATTTEIFPLTLLSVGGMMLFPAANDLMVMFIALEVLSLPLYVLCGLARRRRLLSQEASLKYFMLGSFSSAFFLFGAVLLYGYAGSMRLDVIADTASCCSRAACSSRSVPCPSTRGRRTSTRGHPPPSPGSWPRAPRWPRSAPCCASSTWPSRAPGWTGSPCWPPSRRLAWSWVPSCRSSRPTSSGSWPTPRSRTPGSSWPA